MAKYFSSDQSKTLARSIASGIFKHENNDPLVFRNQNIIPFPSKILKGVMVFSVDRPLVIDSSSQSMPFGPADTAATAAEARL